MFNIVCPVVSSIVLALSLTICANCCQALVWQDVARESQGYETEQHESPQQELPTGAVWKIENTGPSSSQNGYFLLAFSPDSKFLATRNRDNVVSIYNVTTRKQLCQLEGGSELIRCIDFSPDSRLFLTTAAGAEERIKVWNTQTGNLELELGKNASFASFLSVGKKDEIRIIALGEESVETFAFPAGENIGSVRWKTNDNEQRLLISRDGRLAVISAVLRNRLTQIQILDLEYKSKVILDGPTLELNKISMSPNGLWLAASYHRDPKIRLWDLRDPHNQKFVLTKQKQTIQSLSFSADSRFLVSTSWDHSAVIWDILTREPAVQLHGHRAHVNASAFSPLDLTLATGASGTQDNSVLVWDLETLLFPNQRLHKAYESFDIIWRELGSNFPAQSFMAVRAIVENHDKFISNISTKIGMDRGGGSNEEFKRWILDLNSPSYKTRQSATRKLLAVRGFVDRLLKAALIDAPSTEVKYRISLILRQPVPRVMKNFDELRRLHRSIFALELIGSEAAITVLESIAAGHVNIDVARDASDSLHRIQSRAQSRANGS